MSNDIVISHGFETDLTGYFFVISHGFPLFLRVKRGLSITVDVSRLDSYCVARVIYRWEDDGDGQRDHLWVGSSTPLDRNAGRFKQCHKRVALLKGVPQVHIFHLHCKTFPKTPILLIFFKFDILTFGDL